MRPAPAPDLYAGMRALPVLSAGTAHSLIRGSGAIAQEAGRAWACGQERRVGPQVTGLASSLRSPCSTPLSKHLHRPLGSTPL